MNKTNKRIKKVIEEFEDLDKMTAVSIARLAYTSNASVTRYVHSLGYKDFFSFKHELEEKKKREQVIKSDLYTSWESRLEDSFIDIEDDLEEACEMLRDKKIYIWCKREYQTNVNNFSLLLTREGYIVTIIDEFFNINNIKRDECIILTIGKIPQTLYTENLDYVCIDYNSYSNNEKSNIKKLKIMPIKYFHYDTLNINFRVTCINLLLAILCEQLCIVKNS